MKDKIEFIRKSLMAGILIGLCADMNMRIGGIPGAILFSIGLLTICMSDFCLFTGKVGEQNNIIQLFIMLLLNMIGVLLIFFMFSMDNFLILGIGCGILMQIGVVGFKKGYPFITIMCIAAFILSGYKHCIAMIYVDHDIIHILLTVLGNIIGAKLAYYGGIKK